MRICVFVLACVCVYVCVRACVRVYVRACVYEFECTGARFPNLLSPASLTSYRPVRPNPGPVVSALLGPLRSAQPGPARAQIGLKIASSWVIRWADSVGLCATGRLDSVGLCATGWLVVRGAGWGG